MNRHIIVRCFVLAIVAVNLIAAIPADSGTLRPARGSNSGDSSEVSWEPNDDVPRNAEGVRMIDSLVENEHLGASAFNTYGIAEMVWKEVAHHYRAAVAVDPIDPDNPRATDIFRSNIFGRVQDYVVKLEAAHTDIKKTLERKRRDGRLPEAQYVAQFDPYNDLKPLLEDVKTNYKNARTSRTAWKAYVKRAFLYERLRSRLAYAYTELVRDIRWYLKQAADELEPRPSDEDIMGITPACMRPGRGGCTAKAPLQTLENARKYLTGKTGHSNLKRICNKPNETRCKHLMKKIDELEKIIKPLEFKAIKNPKLPPMDHVIESIMRARGPGPSQQGGSSTA